MAQNGKKANIHLNTLYDVLSALRTYGSKEFYLNDIGEKNIKNQ